MSSRTYANHEIFLRYYKVDISQAELQREIERVANLYDAKVNKLLGPEASQKLLLALRGDLQELLNAQYKRTSFVSPDSTFSVVMPGVPTVQSIPLTYESKGRVLTILVSSYTLNTPFCFYSVSEFMLPDENISEMSSEAVSGDSTRKVLDSMRDGVIRETGATLLREEHIRLDGHPGRAVWVETKDGRLQSVMRLYLVKGKAYQLIVVASKDYELAQEAAEFFNSFKLLRQ